MATEFPDDPFITTVYDCHTGQTIVRPMTVEEKQQLIDSGWTLETQEETPTEEAPASDDAGAPSTDAG